MMSAEMWDEMEARAGVLRRDLTHALHVAAALDREIREQRQLAPGISADIVAAAVAYIQAGRREDTPAMLATFAALVRAVGAWETQTRALVEPPKP